MSPPSLCYIENVPLVVCRIVQVDMNQSRKGIQHLAHQQLMKCKCEQFKTFSIFPNKINLTLTLTLTLLVIK